VKFCLLIVSLSVILLQLKLTKVKLEVLKSDFQPKKDMNTDKLAINWQNFARVRLQLKFAFIIRPIVKFNISTSLMKLIQALLVKTRQQSNQYYTKE